MTSFTRYVPDATRQNTMNAPMTRAVVRQSPRTPAAAGAMNTRTFLIHCGGRMPRTRASRGPEACSGVRRAGGSGPDGTAEGTGTGCCAGVAGPDGISPEVTWPIRSSQRGVQTW